MKFIEKAFGFNPSTMQLKTELIAGATTLPDDVLCLGS